MSNRWRPNDPRLRLRYLAIPDTIRCDGFNASGLRCSCRARYWIEGDGRKFCVRHFKQYAASEQHDEPTPSQDRGTVVPS